MRLLGLGRTYSAGTFAISSGVVTLTGGTFPTWAAAGTVDLGGVGYTVASRGGDTAITLDDTSVTDAGPTAYVLLQTEEPGYDAVTDCIKSGQRSFYAPVPMGENSEHKTPYVWSFLNPATALSLTVAEGFDYDLPDNFDQVLSHITYGVGVIQEPIQIVSVPELQAMRAQDNVTGAPQYVATRPKAIDQTDGQRFEAIFYPTPDATYVAEYSYKIAPSKMTPTNKYPLGGLAHSDTILESCLAAAEIKVDGTSGVHGAAFQARMAASVQIDKRASRIDGKSYRNTAVTIGSYDWLAQEVGVALNVGANAKTWGHNTERRVNSFIQRGLKQFYMPAQDGMHKTHLWSFMRPVKELSTKASYSTGTVTIVSGVVTLTVDGTFPTWAASGEIVISGTTYAIDTRESNTQVTLEDTTDAADSAALTTYIVQQTKYDLESDFAGFSAPQTFTFQPGVNGLDRPIEIIPDNRIRSMYQGWETTDQPRYASLRPKALVAATGRRWEVFFWPPPDDVYLLTYRCKVDPVELLTGEFPYCGSEHSETILASCISLVDKSQAGRFRELMAASIEMDQAEMAPARLGRNRDPSTINSDGQYIRDGNTISFDNTSL